MTVTVIDTSRVQRPVRQPDKLVYMCTVLRGCSPVVSGTAVRADGDSPGPVSGYAFGAEEGPDSVPGAARGLRSRW